jgi:hypothetical protein
MSLRLTGLRLTQVRLTQDQIKELVLYGKVVLQDGRRLELESAGMDFGIEPAIAVIASPTTPTNGSTCAGEEQ